MAEPCDSTAPAPHVDARAGRWFLGIAIYFLLVAGARCFVTDSVELDESEQVILTQSLALGYNSQPPLYTWLQWGFMSLLGINLVALVAFKTVVKFALLALMFLCVKQVTQKNLPGLVAVAGMLLLPEFVWESQRDLTHSVLATTLSIGTLYLLLRLLNQPTTRDYLLLGICMAAGVLSKYNYLVFLAGLFGAALTLRRGRQVMTDWRMGVSLALAALLLAPHAAWMLTHRAEVLTASYKLVNAADSTFLLAWGKGLLSLMLAVLAYGWSLILVAGWAFRGTTAPAQTEESAAWAPRLIARSLLGSLLVCVVLVFCFKAQFKHRWMQPVLFVLPVYFALLAERRLSYARQRQILGLAVATASAALVALPATPLLASVVNRPTRLNSPYAALAARFREQAGEPAVMVADSRLTGGNLRLHFKQSLVVVPWPGKPLVPQDAALVMVWDATRTPQPPKYLVNYVTNRNGRQLMTDAARYVEAPLKYFPAQSMKLGFLEVPAAGGDGH